ncbi:IclR family transcriptional regulator domain-containing protein [Streptomyces griseoloalbus]|uniref:IclR family transcriptional regulator domain-containing protein n=1 Tax=Streptomyces griseoloalbus TaxID=67303 RepID=UPI003F53EB96
MADIRTAGYALVDQEWERGPRAIAVPVRDRTGRTVAARNAATHAARRTPQHCVDHLTPALLNTATHTAPAYTHVPRPLSGTLTPVATHTWLTPSPS